MSERAPGGGPSATILTERCELSSLREEDALPGAALFRDPLVRQYLGGPLGAERSVERFREILLSPQPGWAVRTRADGAFLGLITIDVHHEGEDREISYMFSPEHWGQGYAYEALLAALHYARD